MFRACDRVFCYPAALRSSLHRSVRGLLVKPSPLRPASPRSRRSGAHSRRLAQEMQLAELAGLQLPPGLNASRIAAIRGLADEAFMFGLAAGAFMPTYLLALLIGVV